MLAWCRVPPDEFSISTRISIIKEQNRNIHHSYAHHPGESTMQIFSNKSSVNQQCPINLIVMDLTFHVCVFFTLFSKGNTIITIPATSTPSASTDISRPVKSTATTRNSRMAASTRRALFTGTAPVVAAAPEQFS